MVLLVQVLPFKLSMNSIAHYLVRVTQFKKFVAIPPSLLIDNLTDFGYFSTLHRIKPVITPFHYRVIGRKSDEIDRITSEERG